MNTLLTPSRRAANAVVRLVKRWAPSPLRRRIWEAEYTSGRWDYLDDGDGGTAVALVEKYAQHGRVLDLGCGTTRNLVLEPGRYAEYVGVDISPDAIARARRSGRPDSRYEVADVVGYTPDGRFDLVFLREVVYYVPTRVASDLLRRTARSLTPTGVIVVVIWNVQLYRRTVEAVRGCGLPVVEEYAHNPGGLTLILTRPGGSDLDAAPGAI